MKVLRSGFKVCSFISIEPKAAIYTAQSPCYTFTQFDTLLRNLIRSHIQYGAKF